MKEWMKRVIEEFHITKLLKNTTPDIFLVEDNDNGHKDEIQEAEQVLQDQEDEGVEGDALADDHVQGVGRHERHGQAQQQHGGRRVAYILARRKKVHEIRIEH